MVIGHHGGMPWSCRSVVCLMAFAAGAAAAPAAAGDAAARHARNLAASCTACHAVSAGPADDDRGRLRSLAGRSEADLLAALRAYRASDRRGDAMVQIAKGYSDAQLAQIAAALVSGSGRAPR